MTEKSDGRGSKLAANRKAVLDKLFTDRKYVVKGEVHLGPDENGAQQVFQTPLGNKGRHGYVLEEVGTGERVVFGKTMILRIAEEYGAFELPEALRPHQAEEDEPRTPATV